MVLGYTEACGSEDDTVKAAIILGGAALGLIAIDATYKSIVKGDPNGKNDSDSEST